MKRLENHPLAELMPPLTDEEYANLAASIVERGGLLRPITLYEGKVLDGRHRYRICLEHRIEPTFEEYDGAEPVHYILDIIQGRGLTAGQKATIAVAYLPQYQAEAAARRRANLRPGGPGRGHKTERSKSDGRIPEDNSKRSMSQVATATGAKKAEVEQMRQVKTLADEGDQHAKFLFRAMQTGDSTVGFRQVRDYLKKVAAEAAGEAAPRRSSNTSFGEKRMRQLAGELTNFVGLTHSFRVVLSHFVAITRSVQEDGIPTDEQREVHLTYVAKVRAALDLTEEVIKRGGKVSFEDEIDELFRREFGTE